MSAGGRYYYGWNIVAAATLVTLLTVGMRMGIGPFFLPITEDLGFTRNELSSIVAVGMLCYGLAMPLAGYGFAWIGHFFFEKNKPATFTYPLYSLAGDWVMYKDILTGRIRF